MQKNHYNNKCQRTTEEEDMNNLFTIEEGFIYETLSHKEVSTLEKKYNIRFEQRQFDFKVVGSYESLKNYYEKELGIEIEQITIYGLE